MRRILTSILTVGMVATLMGVGTFAYFNDTENASATITAGIIDLEIDGENPWCESIDIELKPTWDWERDFILHMTRESNSAKACFNISGVVDSGGILSEPEYEAEGGTYTDCISNNNNVPVDNLSDHIKVDISFNSTCPDKRMWYIDENGDGDYEWVAKPLSWDWKENLDDLPTLAEFNTIGWIKLTTDCLCNLPENLTPCTDYMFHLSFHNILNGCDDEYQGDTTTFTIEFYVTQTDNPECGEPCDGEDEFKDLSIPQDTMTMVVEKPGAISYFDTTLSDVPSGYDVTNGTYLGWCCDEDHGINSGEEYTVTLYSSYNSSMPDYFKDPDWDKVNYILNYKQGTWEDVQDAIWYFIDHGAMPSPGPGKDMVTDAVANGGGFKPSSGQWMAVICDAGDGIQHTFIEVDP